MQWKTILGNRCYTLETVWAVEDCLVVVSRQDVLTELVFPGKSLLAYEPAALSRTFEPVLG